MSLPVEKFGLNAPQKALIRRLLRRVFIEDWLIKLVALMITLALWLGVSGLRAPITTRLNNIVLQPRISNSLEIINSPVTEVALVVTGDRRKIDQIKPENLIVSLDLTSVLPGDRIVQLTPENVNVELPTGVRLDEIQPNKIAVQLETVTEREIPVKAEIEGSTSENVEIYGETIVPPRVRVRGPSSYIKSLEFVPTEPINLENRNSDFAERQVPLNLSNPKATVLDAAVDVFFRIGEKRVERLFIVPVNVNSETESANPNAGKKATVLLFAARSILENLRVENLRVEIIKNEAGEESPQLILPVELQGKIEIRNLKIN